MTYKIPTCLSGGSSSSGNPVAKVCSQQHNNLGIISVKFYDTETLELQSLLVSKLT